MTDPFEPSHGARFSFELERKEPARYRIEVHAPSARWMTVAEIGEAGFDLGSWQGASAAPEPWMVENARAFLRVLFKNHAADRSWPRRMTRWRAPHE